MKAKANLFSRFLRAWGRGKVTNLLTLVVALTLATVTPALAANGGNFLLGKANLATAVTLLQGTVAGPALQVYNPSTSTAATAALFQVASGHPPFKVTSATKVPNLNSDLLDGKDSTGFLGASQKAADSDKLDGKSAEDLTRVALMETSAYTPLPQAPEAVTYGQVLSITAPAAGFVRVNSNATVENTGCTTLCAYQGRIRHIQDGTTSLPSEGDLAGLESNNIGMDKVFQVNAGVNTFDIRLSQYNQPNATLAGVSGTLTAEYTPYGSTGAGTLSSSAAATD